MSNFLAGYLASRVADIATQTKHENNIEQKISAFLIKFEITPK
jgi:hypothetical protein